MFQVNSVPKPCMRIDVKQSSERMDQEWLEADSDVRDDERWQNVNKERKHPKVSKSR
jgi:hypothetical protein